MALNLVQVRLAGSCFATRSGQLSDIFSLAH